MLPRFLTLLLTFLLIAGPAGAAASGIEVEKAWARATPSAGATGIVYLTLINTGPAADRLIGVSTPLAAAAGLHIMVMEGTVMQMHHLDALDVKPGESVTFKPSGLHIMLTQVKQALKPGDRFPLTLDFEKAGAVEVQVLVLPLGASSYP